MGLLRIYFYPSTDNSKNDETKIQGVVALDMRSGCPKLIGWIDTGEENLHAKIMKEKMSN